MHSEIEKFAQWAATHNGSPELLDRQTMETLKREKPFFYRIFAERREAWQKHLLARHLRRRKEKIERADRRYSNRSRRLTRSYLDTDKANERLGCTDAYNLRILGRQAPTSPFKDKLILSDAELLSALEADLAALNEELADQGQEPASFNGSHRRDALCWKWEVTDMEDTDGDTHDMGTYEVYLTTRGTIYVYGGDYEQDGHVHPHVHSDGGLCTGDFQNFRDLICMSGSLLTAFQTINGILETFNAESPYIKLSELVYGHDTDDEDDGYICHSCECSVSEDEVYQIGDYDYCSDCCWTCDKCYEHYAQDHHEPIVVNDTYYCPDCASEHLVKCYECETWILETKAVWGWSDDEEKDVPLCEGCHTSCEDCGKLLATSSSNHYGGCDYCSDCHDDLRVSCHLCNHTIYKDDGYEFTRTDGEDCWVCHQCHEKLEQLGILPGAEAPEPAPADTAPGGEAGPNLQAASAGFTAEAVLTSVSHGSASQLWNGIMREIMPDAPITFTIGPTLTGRLSCTEENLSTMPAGLVRD